VPWPQLKQKESGESYLYLIKANSCGPTMAYEAEAVDLAPGRGEPDEVAVDPAAAQRPNMMIMSLSIGEASAPDSTPVPESLVHETVAQLEHEEAARMHAAKEAAAAIVAAPTGTEEQARANAKHADQPSVQGISVGEMGRSADVHVRPANGPFGRCMRCRGVALEHGQSPKVSPKEAVATSWVDQSKTAIEAAMLRIQLRPIFDKFDANSSGTVSTTELAEMCKAIGMNLTPEELQAIVNDADPDNSGEIDFDEFVATLVRQQKEAAANGGKPKVNLSSVVSTAGMVFGWITNPRAVLAAVLDDIHVPSAWVGASSKPAAASAPTVAPAAPEGEAPAASEATAPEPGVFSKFYEGRRGKIVASYHGLAPPPDKRRDRKQTAHTERLLSPEDKQARERGWNPQRYYNVPPVLKGVNIVKEEPWTIDADRYLNLELQSDYVERRKPYRKSNHEVYMDACKLREDHAPPGKPEWDSQTWAPVPASLRGIRVHGTAAGREPWARDAEREWLHVVDNPYLEREKLAALMGKRALQYVPVDEAVYEANMLALQWAHQLAHSA